MAVDKYVPATREARPRAKTQMPPAKPWRADRPGDIVDDHPMGGPFGYQGPDQGYALRLASMYEEQALLEPGERWEDVEYGVAQVASRRASMFGRAPIRDDVELALIAWGFLVRRTPDRVLDEVKKVRRPLFADVVHDHARQREIAEGVTEDALRLTPAEAEARMAAGELLIHVAG